MVKVYAEVFWLSNYFLAILSFYGVNINKILQYIWLFRNEEPFYKKYWWKPTIFSSFEYYCSWGYEKGPNRFEFFQNGLDLWLGEII